MCFNRSFVCFRLSKKLSVQGFSLIELMTSVSVLSILLVLAAPSFSAKFKQSKIDKSFDALYHLIHLAREEAVNSGMDTLLCPTQDGINCSNEWGEQYIAMIDSNNNAKLDEGEQLLHQLYLDLPAGELKAHLSANKNRISFKPLGLTNGVWGRVCFKYSNGQFYKRKLVFSLANFRFREVSPKSKSC